MKSWKRKATLTGPRLRATMEPHEVQILHTLVSNVSDLLEQRRDSAPRDELAELTGMRSGHSEAPDSPPLARLLPDFHRAEAADAEGGDDAEAAARAQNSGMRLLHEPEIIDAKLGSAAVVLRTLPARGGTVSLTRDQAESWLNCLNDVRLGLGAVLMESRAEGPDGSGGAGGPGGPGTIPETLPDSDPRAAHLEVYHWLTFMQDSLCTALAGGTEDR